MVTLRVIIGHSKNICLSQQMSLIFCFQHASADHPAISWTQVDFMVELEVVYQKCPVVLYYLYFSSIV